ncbi:MAG: asparagine synthase-related protein [Luteimonas sp.]
MFRYVACTWNALDTVQCMRVALIEERMASQLPEFRRVFAIQGLQVYFVGDGTSAFGVHALPQAAGVVLGRLFHHPESDAAAVREVSLDDADAAALHSDQGRSFQRTYWGRYVAFVAAPEGSGTLVLPDPTGEVPCNYLEDCGATWLFSNAADMVALNLVRFAINWRYVSARLYDPGLQVSDTGLEGVSQLRSGEVMRIANGVLHRRLSWDLFALAASSRIDDPAQAVTLTRQTVRACVNAWASCHPRSAHMLSGGIDSSIVLAGLLHAPSQPDVVCLNVHDPRVGGDERRFARLAASEIRSPSGRRAELIECERDVAAVDLSRLSHVRLEACPESYLSDAAYGQFYRRVAPDPDIALFTGLGGDYIFCRTSSARPAADYVHDRGIDRSLWRMVQDNTGKRTYWSVLWEALGVGLFHLTVKLAPLPGARAFVHPEVIEEFEQDRDGYLVSRWTREAGTRKAPRLAPGKQRHIEAMYCPVRRNDPLESRQPVSWCSPLLSQPLMELHARIPVYVLRRGGRERALARRAFRDDLPRAIADRLSKSVTNHFLHDVFRRHEAFFRHTLLDGILVRERLLDRGQLERFFAHAQDGYTDGFSHVIGSYIDTELWLRRWERVTGAGRNAALERIGE